MTDNMKEFLEAASKDEALKSEVKALAAKFDTRSADEEALKAVAIELAAKHGFTLTVDDFKFKEMPELTEDEMKSVAGGAEVCVCPVVGVGGEEGGPGIDCYCIIGSQGRNNGADGHPICCACPAIGLGIVNN